MVGGNAMKRIALLALVGLLCAASAGWAGQAVRQDSKEGLFDIVFDIVTAPCALLATCLGLNTATDCTVPTKVKVVKVAKKAPGKSPAVGPERKSSPVMSDAAAPEKPAPSDQGAPQQQDPAHADKPIPMQKFTAPEKQASSQGSESKKPETSHVTVASPEPNATKPQDKTMPEKELKPEPKMKAPEKPTRAAEQPAVGTVGDASQKPKAPELSPPKIEQSSTQSSPKPAPVPAKKQETKKKSHPANYGGYPCGPYYQPYPSCGPRFFFR
jgi:hypothetical protein